MVRPVLGPNVTARYEHELAAIDGIGLTDIEMDAVISLIAGHVEGAARRSLEAALAERRTGSERSGMVGGARANSRTPDRTGRVSRSRVASARRRARPHNAAYAPEHTFRFGLQRILDGIEALVASRASDD